MLPDNKPSPRAKYADIEPRFLKHIGVDPLSGCWTWITRGEVNHHPKFALGSDGIVSVWRAAYLMYVGDVPTGEHVRHTCDFKACCNPEHLTAPALNAKDRRKAASALELVERIEALEADLAALLKKAAA
jgi:hypothetical protein